MQPTTYPSADGFHFTLTSISQTQTYSGMLEGLPTVEGNQRLLDGLSSMNVGPYDLPPLVLPARRTSIEWDREKPYPFGTPSALPPVQIDSIFSSTQEVKLDPARYPGYSALRVIWFQHEWALPIAPEIVEQLKALQWAEKALDVEY